MTSFTRWNKTRFIDTEKKATNPPVSGRFAFCYLVWKISKDTFSTTDLDLGHLSKIIIIKIPSLSKGTTSLTDLENRLTHSITRVCESFLTYRQNEFHV